MPGLVEKPDLLDRGLPFLFVGTVDLVVVSDPDHLPVGRDRDDRKLVDRHELGGFRLRRSGHARKFAVHSEVVLEGDRRKGLVLLFDLDPLLGLQSLVETLGVAASRHETPGELVDDQNLPVLHHVVHVSLEKGVGLEGLVDGLEKVHVLQVEEVDDVEALLGPGDAALFQGDGLRLLVELVVFTLLEGSDKTVHPGVDLRGLLGGTGDDQRGTGLIDQNAVHLVDNGEVMAPLG